MEKQKGWVEGIHRPKDKSRQATNTRRLFHTHFQEWI